MTPTEFAEALEARLEGDYEAAAQWAANVEIDGDPEATVPALKALLRVTALDVDPPDPVDPFWLARVEGYVESGRNLATALMRALVKVRGARLLRRRDADVKVCANCRHCEHGWEGETNCRALGFEMETGWLQVCDRWEGES